MVYNKFLIGELELDVTANRGNTSAGSFFQPLKTSLCTPTTRPICFFLGSKAMEIAATLGP
jgi:hypothetical protein